MEANFPYKRSYHPFLIVLFHLELLDKNILRQIPYSTRKYWNGIAQEKQFGYPEVSDYLDAQRDIRSVFTSKKLFSFMRFSCRMYDGYNRIIHNLQEVKNAKSNIRKIIVESVAHLSQTIKVSLAARIMNISTQKYYRWKSQTECKLSKIRKCFRSVTHQL
ncbi:MAG: hypothetical protein M3R17_13330, partial [Bacteroidota bacterium]|nr:hypothetical protein [Bacteroidota bacterium]